MTERQAVAMVHPAFAAWLLELRPSVGLVPRELSPLASAGDDRYALFVADSHYGAPEWLFVGSVADEWGTFDRLAAVLGEEFADRAWLDWCAVTHAAQLQGRRA